MLLRILIIAIIAGAVAYGLRRIWRDWTQNFRDVDAERRQRDLKERARPDVIELKRNPDGVFRPPGKDDERSS
jgi:hypothetical protein